MLNIKEIAEQVSKRIYVEDGLLLSKFISEKFAEAIIAEIVKQNEPVACVDKRDWDWHLVNSPETSLGIWPTSDWKRKLNLPYQVPMFFYTSDQLAASILKATGPLEDQLAAAQEEINSPPAIDAYEMYMADDEESNPVERLRFFLSLALKDQDWIDVEKFIDDVSNHIAKAEQRVSEACAKWIDGYAGIHQKEMLSDTAKSFADALRRGEWRKFVKEV